MLSRVWERVFSYVNDRCINEYNLGRDYSYYSFNINVTFEPVLQVLSFLKNYYLFIYLFIFVCVGSSFLCEGFLQLRQAGATLHRGAQASHYRGLSYCRAQAPNAQAQ